MLTSNESFVGIGSDHFSLSSSQQGVFRLDLLVGFLDISMGDWVDLFTGGLGLWTMVRART